MSFVRSCLDVENWLSEASAHWQIISDREYRELISNWKKSFWQCIETKQQHQHGLKAQTKLKSILPVNAYIFSGLKVEAAANMGGNYPSGYLVQGLSSIDWSLCKLHELIVTDVEFGHTLICSHEDGYEQFYEIV